MSLTLYFGPGACSFVPHVLLEATGVPFDPRMVALHKGEQRSEAYLRDINPEGLVPVLFDGDLRVRQIIAICSYLADRFPEQGFIPTEPKARAAVLEPLAWFNNTVHGTFSRVFKPSLVTPDEALHPAIRAAALETFRGQIARIEQMVVAAQARGAGPQGIAFLGGERLGPLDPYALTLSRWGSMVGIDPADHPTLWAWLTRLADHPPVARALARERVPLNMFKPKATA